MGSEVVKAVGATDDLQIVAALDLEDSLEDLVKSGAQVVVDFTHPDSVMKNLEFAINNGINVVVGTTGFDTEKLNNLGKISSLGSTPNNYIQIYFNPELPILFKTNVGTLGKISVFIKSKDQCEEESLSDEKN